MKALLLLACLVIPWAWLSPALAVESPDPAGIDFFEKKIRPVLIEHCYKCHAADAKTIKGGLVMDTRDGLLKGGDSGPAIVPGKTEAGTLIAALHYGEDSYKMPPAGKLPPEVIADFEKWVRLGAPDPRSAVAAPAIRAEVNIAEGRKFWSFQKPVPHPVPEVQHKDWVRDPLDAFVLAKMEERKLVPSAQANKHTLLRRAYFDLIGLPPTPAEVQAFLTDESPAAYERVIDHLLASPHYGERWGRHWLDVVRYAEDNTNMGPFNGPYEFAWRYRDWVVQALNKDLPYDEFVKQQLAADMLPNPKLEDLPALGMMGLSPSNHKELLMAKIDLDRCFADEWEDRVDAIGRGLLGLTIACARCHDHKFDPIKMEDYYALAGVFASSRQTTRPLISQAEIDASEPARKEAAELAKQLEPLEKQLPPAAAEEKKLAEGLPPDPVAAELRSDIAWRKARIEELKRATPNFEIPQANALTEETTLVEEVNAEQMKLVHYPTPRDLPVYVRGDVGKPGPVVPRRFVEVLCLEAPQPFSQGSGRLGLAQAIASAENPLFARVIVNRVWKHHFGTGLVPTPSNFGHLGEAPTRPELLDQLAVSFIEDGWSLKRLHRRIMLSATYRQASRVSPEQIAADPENVWLGRYPARRLEVEPYRDAMLAASGRLDSKLGGPSQPLDNPELNRRTIYGVVSRHKLDDTLAAFDFPDPNIHAERRSTTTTPLQQLFVLNSGFMRQQAAALADRVAQESGPALADQVRLAHLLLFSREPTAGELQLAEQFLSAAENTDQSSRWQRYLQALMASNEMLYVD